MNHVPIFVGQKVLRHDPVLELRRQPPFGGDHVVARQVPPEIIVLGLRAALHLPPPANLEGFAVHDEDARRAVGAILAAPAETRDINAFRPAMDRMRAGIARLRHQLLRLDDLVDLRFGRAGVRVDDIDAGRPDARHDQIPPLQKGVPRHRRQGGGAGVPAEMVKLVTLVGHVNLVNDLAVFLRFRVHVHNRHAVRLRPVRTQHQRISVVLRRRLHRHLGCRVKCRIGSDVHDCLPMTPHCYCRRRRGSRLACW